MIHGRMKNLGLSITRRRFLSRNCGFHPTKQSQAAAKQAASSSYSIHANDRPDQSVSIASAGLQAAKSSSFARVVDRSAASLKALSSACHESL